MEENEKKKKFDFKKITDPQPEVRLLLRTIGAALALLLIWFMGSAAITFCLGLFADGNYVVIRHGKESPILELHEIPDETKPVYVDPGEAVEIARAEIAVAGDLMLHMPIVRTSQTDNGYNFEDIFTYIKSYISAADFAAINLETTLSGTDSKEYTGYPNFNSPDAIASDAKKAGFDLLLTGNNHCYDYGTAGLKRTLSVLKGQSLPTLGTLESKDQSRHVIQNIGGVKVGMINYTFAESNADHTVLKLNDHATDSDASGLICAFDYSKLSLFYTEMESEIAAMRASGADSIILYLHWGDEYSPSVSDRQRSIAQKMCDLGVDVIVGSHPHVVQPIDLLTSSVDPAHKMLCMYSLGNFLSNQRADTISMDSGLCEDGVLVNFTLAKYSDGSVRIMSVSTLPTWVVVRGTGEDRDFHILPLDEQVSDWATAFDLDKTQLTDAQKSLNRTIATVTPGLNKVSAYIAERNSFLDPSLGVG